MVLVSGGGSLLSNLCWRYFCNNGLVVFLLISRCKCNVVY